MAAHAARRLLVMTDNLAGIIGVELLVGAQGVEMRAPLRTSAILSQVIAGLRRDVPALGDDRILAPDIETASSLIRSGAIVDAAGSDHLPNL